MPDNVLSISVQVDASQLSGVLQPATAVANDAFTSLAAAQIRVSTASKELNSTLNTLAKAGLAPTTEQTEEVAAAMFEAKTATDAFKTAQVEAYGATERMTGGVNNARIAFTGLTQDLGLRGSRALGSFIAQSETLGPILQSAFSGIAVLAFIEIASRIPEVIKKASESLAGWTKEAKEAYQVQLKLNETIGEHRKELELEKIANAEAGLKGTTKTAQEIADTNRKIELLGQYLIEQGKIAAEAERELEAVRVIPAHMAGRVLVQQQEVKVIEEGSEAWKERTEKLKEAQAKVEQYHNEILKLQQVETPRTNALFSEQQAAEAEKGAEEIQKLQERAAREHDRLEKQKEAATHKRIMAELNDEERLAKERIKEAETEAAMDREFNRNAEQEEKKLDANIAAAKKNLFETIVKAQEVYLRDQAKLQRQEEKQWEALEHGIEKSFDSMFRAVIAGHQSFTRAISAEFNKMIANILAGLARWLEQYVLNLAIGKALHRTTQADEVLVDAKAGAAAAFKSVMQALPFPLNVALAPPAAAAAFVGIEAFSAAGGMLVPADGALSMLHKNEMVLPASLSQGVQRMVSGGGGAGFGFGDEGPAMPPIHFHINATDASGVKAFFDEHSDKVIDIIHRARREFRI